MNLIHEIVGSLIKNDFFWFFFKPLSKVGAYLQTQRNKKLDAISLSKEKERLDNLFAPIIQQRIVLHGPFKELKYPQTKAYGSALYPKLIGSYEMELQPIIENICNTPYSAIINIGCGEGYYAIGLARRITNATIYAFDTDALAREGTIEMARVNRVENRVRIESTCTAKYLAQFPFSGKSLIVCDCEGFEEELFVPSNLENLKQIDLLIEVHDFIDINISTYLNSLFSSTHTITSVKSLDDIEKAKTYAFNESDQYDLKTRWELFREGRPAIMEWLFLTPKIKK